MPHAGAVVYKMTGSGNDFVMVDGRFDPPDEWSPQRVSALCDRRSGLGADGLVVLVPVPGHAPAHVRFHFFNRDGSRASMCGNAALCATRLACWLELSLTDEVVLETDAGEVSGRCVPNDPTRSEITLPPVAPVLAPEIPLVLGETAIRLTQVGVPHVVVVVNDVQAVALPERGRQLRFHPAVGDAGANVNFVGRLGSGWTMRTYERGVEGETLACGTGAAAAASVLLGEGEASLPIDFRTASGKTLSIAAKTTRDCRLEETRLGGEGRLVYRAILGA